MTAVRWISIFLEWLNPSLHFGLYWKTSTPWSPQTIKAPYNHLSFLFDTKDIPSISQIISFKSYSLGHNIHFPVFCEYSKKVCEWRIACKTWIWYFFSPTEPRDRVRVPGLACVFCVCLSAFFLGVYAHCATLSAGKFAETRQESSGVWVFYTIFSFVVFKAVTKP